MSRFSDQFIKIAPCETPRAGSLLIARPFLEDNNFTQSVVLMVDCESSTGEALGVVLNHRLSMGINDVISGIDLPGNPPLSLGGPVGHDRLVVLHTLGAEIIPGSTDIGGGLYLGGDFGTVKEYVRGGGETSGCMKLLIGYSGWSAGQLQQELDDGTWAVGTLPVETIMGCNGPAMWKEAVSNLDDRYSFWKSVPLKADLN